MTTPATASTDAAANRVYTIPDPRTKKLAKLTSVTGVIALAANPALETWMQKTIAEAMAFNPELVELAATDPYRATRQALSNREEANFGTKIHLLIEKADRGELDWSQLDDPAAACLQHYMQLKEAWGWDIVLSEATVFNHQAAYAGTLDRVLDVPNVGRIVAAVNTGCGVYPEVAIQLAMYANALGVWDGEEHHPMPGRNKSGEKVGRTIRTDLGWALHLRPKGAAVIPVDLTGAWAVATSLCCLHRWQIRDDVIGAPLSPPGNGRMRDWLIARIYSLKNIDGALDELAKCWPRGVPTLKNCNGHTAAQLELIGRAVGAAEKAFEAPFVDVPEKATTDNREIARYLQQ